MTKPEELAERDNLDRPSLQSDAKYQPPSVEDIPKLAKRAAGWTIFLTVVRQFLTIGTTMIVSRHVTPSDFGVAAMALTFLAFLVLFDTALTWATVQAPAYDNEKLGALFYIGLLLGLGLFGLALVAGPFLASFYAAPELTQLCAFVGGAAFLNSLSTQPAALLRRRLQQKKLNLIDTMALTVSCAVGSGLALTGFGIWAVVSQTLSLHAVRSIAILVLSDYVPTWPRKFTVALPEIRKGAGFALSNYFCYFQLYLGGILAGRHFGSEAMGNYQRSYAVKSMPTQYASMVVTDVMVSSLAALKSEPEKLATLYRKALIATAIIGCPAGAFLFSGSTEVIRILYGPQWLEAAHLLQWFSLAAMALPISTSTIWLFLAAGKARAQLHMNIILTCFSLVTLLSVVFVSNDVKSLVIAESLLFSLPYLAMNLVCSHRALSIPLLPTIRSVAPIVGASLLAGAASYAVSINFTAGFWSVFACKLLTFLIVYAPIVIFLVRPLPFSIANKLLNQATPRKQTQ